MLSLFLALVFTHLLADFPLQGDFLAKAKNHRAPIPGVPWFYCLMAHAFICAGAVSLCVFVASRQIGLSICLGVAEFAHHALTDYAKNEGRYGEGSRAFVADQVYHLSMKLAIASGVALFLGL